MRKIEKHTTGQAMAPEPVTMNKTDFENHKDTRIYWMGNASILINSYGTDIMIDPLLSGFDMPLLRKIPLNPADVDHTDGVLITHYDNDHYSRDTIRQIKDRVDSFHAPYFVASTMPQECEAEGTGHAIGETFDINDIRITLTPTLHNWQNGSSKYNYRYWAPEDYCGFWIETRDGSIWLPGDSKLLQEHLQMPEPDVILFDFADNDWHITLEGAITLANTYPQAQLICIHWGCVDAPAMTPFSGNPETLYNSVVNPERIQVLAPGEYFVLSRKG